MMQHSKLKKIILTLFTVLVVIILSTTLFACHKKDDKKREREIKERNDSVASVENSILNAIDNRWSMNLNVDKTAELSNAADFILMREWTRAVGNVVNNSSLQTSKIKALKDELLSENGQKLLKDFQNNAEFIIPIVKTVGFTPEDVALLAYDLVYALINDVGDVLERSEKILGEVNMCENLNREAKAGIDRSIVEIYKAKDAYIPKESEKENMLKSIAAAKEPLVDLVSFLYNMSLDAITDNVYSMITGGGGALSDISNGEIAGIATALQNNVSALKTSLNAEAIGNLNSVLKLVIDKFDNNYVSYSLYAEIVHYAKYLNILIDAIPSICDLGMAAIGNFKNDAFLTEFKDYVEKNEALDKDTQGDVIGYNNSLFAFKLIYNTVNKFTYEDVRKMIENAILTDDYQKVTPIIILDIALNAKGLEDADYDGNEPLKNLKFTDHGEITGEDFMSMVNVLMLNMSLDAFKKTYYEYNLETNTDKKNSLLSRLDMYASLCGFKDILGADMQNPYSRVDNTKAWYEYYLTVGIDAANAITKRLSETIKNDILSFANVYYNDENSDMRKAFSKLVYFDYASVMPGEAEYEEFYNAMWDSSMYGVYTLLTMFN